jgi:paraquat-inducible protein A
MLDVFLIGVFVSLVKLVKMGTIIPGMSLWAFMILVFVLAGMQVIYNPHQIWEMISHTKGQKETVV